MAPWPYPSSGSTALLTGMEGLAYPPFQPTPGRYSQGIHERLDYDNDWSDWVPAGDAIITSTWTVIPFKPTETGLVVEDGGYTSTSTTVWVSGGNEATSYTLLNLVTTTGGRAGQRSVEVKITGRPHHRFACLTGHGALTGVAHIAA